MKAFMLGECPSCPGCGVFYSLLVDHQAFGREALLVQEIGDYLQLLDAPSYRELVQEMSEDGVKCEPAAIVLIERRLSEQATRFEKRILVRFLNDFYGSDSPGQTCRE